VRNDSQSSRPAYKVTRGILFAVHAGVGVVLLAQRFKTSPASIYLRDGSERSLRPQPKSAYAEEALRHEERRRVVPLDEYDS
jgi:hypothetical protein